MGFIRNILCLAAAAALFIGCTEQDVGMSSDGLSDIVVCLCGSGETRSQVSASLAEELRSVRIYVYEKETGTLYAEVSTSAPQAVIRLDKARSYKAYVLANMPSYGDSPYLERELLSRLYDGVTLQNMKTGGLPMCGSAVIDAAVLSRGTVSVEMTRLVSRVGLTVDKSGLASSMLVITSVAVRQAVSRVAPFCGPFVALSSDDIVDGDSSTTVDVNTLNNGGKAWFYVPENSQGILLPGNSDPWLKEPSSIAGKGGLCTFLEIKAEHSGIYEGVPVSSNNTTYRFYLGNDNIRDFSVGRNQTIDITLKVTDEGMYADGWKVEYGAALPVVSYELSIEPSDIHVYCGETTDVVAMLYKTVNGVRGAGVDVSSSASWSSSAPGVASVSGGTVRGEAPGSCVITAEYDGVTATADVTIEDSITYDYVFFISGYNSITAGEDTEPYKVYYYTNTYTNGVLSDTGSDATLFTGQVTWSVTSGSQSGSISSAGVLHAIKEGTVRITASMTFEDSGRSAYKDVTVTKPSNAGTDTGWEDGGDVDYD